MEIKITGNYTNNLKFFVKEYNPFDNVLEISLLSSLISVNVLIIIINVKLWQKSLILLLKIIPYRCFFVNNSVCFPSASYIFAIKN